MSCLKAAILTKATALSVAVLLAPTKASARGGVGNPLGYNIYKDGIPGISHVLTLIGILLIICTAAWLYNSRQKSKKRSLEHKPSYEARRLLTHKGGENERSDHT